MHADLARRFIRLQALLITPLAPHWAESVWRDLLHEPSSIQDALYPTVPAPDAALLAVQEYIELTTSTILRSEAKQLKKRQKGLQSGFDPKKSKKLSIFIANSFPEWQERYRDALHKQFESTGKLDMKVAAAGLGKAEMKRAMPFMQALKARLESGETPERVFERQLPFNETEVLREMVLGLKSVIKKLQAVEVIRVDGAGAGEVVVSSEQGSGTTRPEGEKVSSAGITEDLAPGKPSFIFENIED